MGAFFLVILTVVYLFACFFLVIIVLMQEGKGGGLSALASGSSPLSDTLGAYAAEHTLRKWTKWLAVTFMTGAVLLTILGPRLLKGGGTLSDRLQDTKPAEASSTAPAGASAPGGATAPVPAAPNAEAPNAPVPAAPAAPAVPAGPAGPASAPGTAPQGQANP